MKIPSLYFLAFVLVLTPLRAAQEFRAAWVATVYNLDWPSKPGLPAATQKAQLRAMLDRAQELKLNAILFQVRPVSDALYASKREPWSVYLTGRQGGDPGYDPLAFAIAEAHARGIELHAWFNPFRAATTSKEPNASNHVMNTHPDWIRRYAGLSYIDPGEPDARRYVLEIILDVVRRYDIDGVHIDDYFYPYPKGGASFPDESTWQRYGASSGMGRADWRRDNVNKFVEGMYHSVKSAKPTVRVGISPFGIWRPGVPSTIEAQLDCFNQLFADSRHWLAQGWCDYLAPQLYWSIDPAPQSFPVLLNWWRQQSRAGEAIWPGIATERVGPDRPASEMVRQIQLTRQGDLSNNAPGHIHWSMKALMNNQGGVTDLLRRQVYGEKADLPRR